MKVISMKQLPFKLPIFQTIVIVMALDFYKASELIKGGVFVLLVILWVTAIIMVIKQKQVEINL